MERARERTRMIAALQGNTLFAPFTFEGSCNREVFNTWLDRILLPCLPPKTEIILDNAAFHKRQQTQAIIQKTGCVLKFLPTYSPDLNRWHQIKSRLKPLLHKKINRQQALEQTLNEMCLF